MNLKRTISLLACMLVLSAASAVSMRGKDGMPVPGTDRDNPAVWAGRPVSMTRGATPGEYSKTRLFYGNEEVLVVLVDFPDRKFTISDPDSLRQKFNDMLNGNGYSDTVAFRGDCYYISGSAKDYFTDQSYGKYVPSFKVIGPITTDSKHNVYGKDITTDNDASSVNSLVREICGKLSCTVDLDKYTRSGEGLIEHLAIIYAGRGQNYSQADPDDIWPQCNTISINIGKVKDVTYFCTCELFWNTDNILDGIGTFCHEFSHTIGLPDYYCTRAGYDNDKNAILGHWSLMDYGNYDNLGFSPAGYTAFERYSLGWLELTDITSPGKYSLEELNGSDPVAYRLNTSDNDKFLILENHQQHGWYRFQQSKGLMVTGVAYRQSDWKNNTVNWDSSSKRYFMIRADNIPGRSTENNDLFPYGSMDSVTWYSLPQLSVNSTGMYYRPDYSIYDIRNEGGTVTFHVGKDRTSEITESKSDAPIQVYDLSGRLHMTLTDESKIPSGLWIVRQGTETKKVKR